MVVSCMGDYLSLLLKPMLYQGGIYYNNTILQQKANKQTKIPQTFSYPPNFQLSTYLSSESVKKGLVFPK